MNVLSALALLSATCLSGQTSPSPFQALAFLEGTWEAQTNSSVATAAGTYTFAKELSGHILARHSATSNCKGPADYNCDHGDLLYIYADAPSHSLKAIYFDNEGHVIHYGVSAPSPSSALFLSNASAPGPRFRLLYERTGVVMSGKFQMQMPGQTEWKSYLEWSGPLSAR